MGLPTGFAKNASLYYCSPQGENFVADLLIPQRTSQMVTAATSPDLKKAFTTHLEQTQHQIKRHGPS
jgi:hypothetical protein